MAIILNTLSYNQDAFRTPNKVAYVGPSSNFEVTDEITLARTAAKPNGTFAGMAKAEVKRTKTLTLPNGTKVPAIITLSFSIPVGAAQADAEALLDDVGDFALSVDCRNLMWKHDLLC